MRGSILCTVVGAAFSLILSANEGYAGAAKTGCTLPMVMVTGTPNSCGVEVPTGTQQVDPPGNIVNPDTTFTSGFINDFGSGTGNSSTFQGFLFPVFDPPFSNNFNGNQSIANSVIEFDGTFDSDNADTFYVNFNCGSEVQIFADKVSLTLTPTAQGGGCPDTGDPDGDPSTPNTFASYEGSTAGLDLGDGTLPFVLDYYTGEGDTDPTNPNILNNAPEWGISLYIDCNPSTNNCTPASDTVTGGTFVPEPGSMSILGGALAGLGIIRRRRKRA